MRKGSCVRAEECAVSRAQQVVYVIPVVVAVGGGYAAAGGARARERPVAVTVEVDDVLVFVFGGRLDEQRRAGRTVCRQARSHGRIKEAGGKGGKDGRQEGAWEASSLSICTAAVVCDQRIGQQKAAWGCSMARFCDRTLGARYTAGSSLAHCNLTMLAAEMARRFFSSWIVNCRSKGEFCCR